MKALPVARSLTLLALIPALMTGSGVQAREIVDASQPQDIAVSVYRNPDAGPYADFQRGNPRGFAMISETRTVNLPAGQSTIRFTGVAEGMVAVSAIVTGLPGGTIEKNRNADLLSPAALVDGTLGNRVTITRTNPGDGEALSEAAIIRTRADGGIVLQTQDGYEAVRCSGLPERLVFDEVPGGLSAQPVFSIDTQDAAGGTFTVTLTYLAWGFDWQANYVATLQEGGDSDNVRLRLMSWLTILNDNDQSFENAQLMAIAGTLNVVSDFEGLADPPTARPLRLTCYPLGSSLTGSPVPNYDRPMPPPPPMAMMADSAIVVTASRRSEVMMEAPQGITPTAMMAGEEDLGDLKLYRIPEEVTVSAKGLKQVSFLDRGDVEGRYLYQGLCAPGSESDQPAESAILFATVNDEDHGLGVALPSGAITFFEPSAAGELLVGEESLRDYASGQDVEIGLGSSAQVFLNCQRLGGGDVHGSSWMQMRATLTNANPAPVTYRLQLGSPVQWTLRNIGSDLKNGQRIREVTVPANGERVIEWRVRYALEE